MSYRIRKHFPTVAIALVAGMVGANAPAIAHGVHALFAHNADKVDGIHAVKATAANKDKRLIATGATGKFPVSVIPKADAQTLDGQDSTAFAPNAHGHDGADVTSGAVDEAFIDPDIARDSEVPPASTYTAGNGLDLSGGNEFSIDPTETQARVTTACSAGQFLRSIGQSGTAVCAADTDTGVNSVTPGAGITASIGARNLTIGASFTGSGGDNGTGTTIARGDHLHDARYVRLSPAAPQAISMGLTLNNALTVGGTTTIDGATTIDDTLDVTGLVRMGSETGTSQPPAATGIVTRRINSTVTTDGSVVARANSNNLGTLDFVRDGTSGGFKLLNDEAGFYSAACMGVNASGASVNKFIPFTDAVSTQVYLDADAMVYISCSFGDPVSSGRAETQLTLRRTGTTGTPSLRWVGYITSTLNQ